MCPCVENLTRGILAACQAVAILSKPNSAAFQTISRFLILRSDKIGIHVVYYLLELNVQMWCTLHFLEISEPGLMLFPWNS